MKKVKNLLLALLTLSSSMAFAQVTSNNPLITLNENGAGSIVFPGQQSTALPGVAASDPGPGGLSNTLTFDLLGPPSLVAGDLRLLDPITHDLSDLIRFNPAGTGSGGYRASVVFYSGVDTSIQLVDVGFPQFNYENLLTLDEIIGGNFYTPGSNDPGYVAGFAVTYKLISNAASVPEPGTIALLGLGLLGFVATRRKTAGKVKS